MKVINLNISPTKIRANTWRFDVTSERIECWVSKFKTVNIKINKPESPGTEAQNAAMHALLAAYFKTGMHNCPEPITLENFKIYIKSIYGPQIFKSIDKKSVQIIKSWANYNKHERRALIEGLISEIHQSGAYAESAEIREIISGMQI